MGKKIWAALIVGAIPCVGVTLAPSEARAAGAAAASKPDWCGTYKPTDDSKAKWVDGYIKSEGWSDRVRNYMALGACDKPDDAARQAQVEKWRAQFIAEMGGNAKDFSEMLAAHINKEEIEKQRTAFCQTVKMGADVPSSTLQYELALANEMDCRSVVRKLVPQVDKSLLIFWNDRGGGADASEIARAVAIVETIRVDDDFGNKYKSAALVLPDVIADNKLDRAKLEKELSANTRFNPLAKARVREVFNHARLLGEKWRATVSANAEAKKVLIDAPAAAVKAWETNYQAHKEAMDFAFDLGVKLNAEPSGASQKGCSAKARSYLAAYLAEKKPSTLDEAHAASTDQVGYPLLSALMQCESVDGHGLAAAAEAHTLYAQKDWREHRGPRYAAYYAALDAFSAARNAKTSLPFENLPNLEHAEATRIYQRITIGTGFNSGKKTGVIASTAASGADGMKVTFKKVAVKIFEQECWEDRSSISGYNPDTHEFTFRTLCNYNGKFHISMVGESPVVVTKEHAALLTVGRAITFESDDRKDAAITGFPLEIFTDKDKKKLVGYVGLGTGGSNAIVAASVPEQAAKPAPVKKKANKKKK